MAGITPENRWHDSLNYLSSLDACLADIQYERKTTYTSPTLRHNRLRRLSRQLLSLLPAQVITLHLDEQTVYSRPLKDVMDVPDENQQSWTIHDVDLHVQKHALKNKLPRKPLFPETGSKPEIFLLSIFYSLFAKHGS